MQKDALRKRAYAVPDANTSLGREAAQLQKVNSEQKPGAPSKGESGAPSCRGVVFLCSPLTIGVSAEPEDGPRGRTSSHTPGSVAWLVSPTWCTGSWSRRGATEPKGVGLQPDSLGYPRCRGMLAVGAGLSAGLGSSQALKVAALVRGARALHPASTWAPEEPGFLSSSCLSGKRRAGFGGGVARRRCSRRGPSRRGLCHLRALAREGLHLLYITQDNRQPLRVGEVRARPYPAGGMLRSGEQLCRRVLLQRKNPRSGRPPSMTVWSIMTRVIANTSFAPSTWPGPNKSKT